MIPLDKRKIMLESWKDIVIRFNGDPYRGRARSVPSQKRYKSANCWTLENVSFLPPPPAIPGGITPPPVDFAPTDTLVFVRRFF